MRVALVTGVSSGIGKVTAALLASRGFRTFGTVRGLGVPEELVEHVRVDVRDAASARAGVEEVLARAGRIDALVNNAGATLLGSGEETTVDEARELFDLNFFGVMRMTQAVLPAMRAQGSGRIVNIGSVLGFLPAPFMGVYAASKHAIEGYSESLDHEVRRFGVRVVVVEPAFTRTRIGQNSRTASELIASYGDDRGRVAAQVRENVTHGGDAFDVAQTVLRAIEEPSPRLRYPAGRMARRLRLLRSMAPASVVDSGIRKTFGLAY